MPELKEQEKRPNIVMGEPKLFLEDEKKLPASSSSDDLATINDMRVLEMIIRYDKESRMKLLNKNKELYNGFVSQDRASKLSATFQKLNLKLPEFFYELRYYLSSFPAKWLLGLLLIFFAINYMYATIFEIYSDSTAKIFVAMVWVISNLIVFVDIAIEKHNERVKVAKLLYDVEIEIDELKNELAQYYEKYDSIPEKLRNAEGMYHIWLLMKDYHYSLTEAIQEASKKNSIAKQLQIEITDSDLEVIAQPDKKWKFQETDELLKEDKN
ncbi:MAG: hypothetical protein V3G42_10045 [Oscillospiraceae bacterium]